MSNCQKLRASQKCGAFCIQGWKLIWYERSPHKGRVDRFESFAAHQLSAISSTGKSNSLLSYLFQVRVLNGAPNSYQDHKSESLTHYPHLASRAAGFFRAHYHQEPDPTNSLLNICGYGGLVRFKKENPHYGGLRENGRR